MQPRLPVRHVRFGPFDLNLQSGELKKGPTRLRVPDQSIEILKTLLERPGDLVTREELRERLWPANTFVDFEHGLNAAVRRLREALGDSPETPTFIETLPRRGYRFVGALDGAPSFIGLAEGETATQGETRPAHSTDVGPLRHLRIGPWHLLTAVGVIALATGLGLWIEYGRRDRASSLASTPARSIPVTSTPGLEFDPALSPDGKYLAFAWQRDMAATFDLYVKLIDGGTPVPLTSDPAIERSPAWSPDGSRIAFVRGRPGRTTVVVVPAFGGPERVVAETETFPASGVSWTPDGKSLVIVDRAPPSTAAIFLCSVDTGERRRLTHPSRDFTDASPAVSPDGQYVAFVRRVVGFTGGSVFVQRLDQLQSTGEPRRMTFDLSTNNLDWTHDSRAIVYDTNAIRGVFGLWRVPVEGGESVAVLANVQAFDPSVARDGSRLVYSKVAFDSNIWDIPGPQRRDRGGSQAIRLIDSTFEDFSPQFSAQGDRIAFVSNRSGNPEIWVSRSDGSQAMQLTTLGAFAGSPRWSDDGKFIAFDSMRTGSWNIYVVGSQGGAVRSVTRDASHSVRPSWSRDGKWIYFGSNRRDDWQIWKAPAGGGAPVQITRQGGFEAFASADGKYLYYARPGARFQGIWQVPVEGGTELQVIDRGVEGGWALADAGLFIINKIGVPLATIEFFDFATKPMTTISRLSPGLRFDNNNPGFAVSRDGQRMLYVQFDQWAADIEMLALR